jgi:hypothetical protein
VCDVIDGCAGNKSDRLVPQYGSYSLNPHRKGNVSKIIYGPTIVEVEEVDMRCESTESTRMSKDARREHIHVPH